MVLADTRIFIDFLRGKKLLAFEGLVSKGEVLLSPIVRLELMQGAKISETQKLMRTLSGFPEAILDQKTLQIASELLMPLKGKGLTVGIPDLLIAAQSIQYQCKLYTNDQFLIKVQKKGWSKLKLY